MGFMKLQSADFSYGAGVLLYEKVLVPILLLLLQYDVYYC